MSEFDPRYAVLVWSHKIDDVTGTNDRFHVIKNGNGGAVNRGHTLGANTKIFHTRHSAIQFMRKWPGHPGRCDPRRWRIVEVVPHFREVVDGWTEKADTQ